MQHPLYLVPAYRHSEHALHPWETTTGQTATDATAEELACQVDVYEDHGYCLLSMSVAKEKISELRRLLDAATRKQLKMSQQRERRIGLRWVEMRDLVSSLRRKRYLPCSIVLDAVESTLSSMDLKALRNEMKVQGRLAVCHRHYSFQARHFCLTLLFYAPDAYRFAARHLRLPRPPPSGSGRV